MKPGGNPENTPTRTGHQLLIVEDDPSQQKLLRHILDRPGREVHVASSSEEALELFDEGLIPDLVILDILLPGMDGIEFLELLRNRYPDIRSIIATGVISTDTIVQAMRLGALDCIQKPFKGEEVQSAVNEALQYQTLSEFVQSKDRKLVFKDGSPFLYSSSVMSSIMETIQQVSDTNVPVLITGESGVGKEVVAREIHQRSNRSSSPFIRINCAALPAGLLEGEIFGFERGAFTGADKSKPSKFELAGDGSLFLDEIGEMEQGLQAKFLHILQDGSYTPLGSNKAKFSNARIIVATNRDVEVEVKTGRFRSDLFHRLSVVRVHIPPLRERPSDIMLLARHFLQLANVKFGKDAHFDPATQNLLIQYPWPGNVRELQNAVNRYAVLGKMDLELEERAAAFPLKVVPRTKEPVPDQETPAIDEVVEVKEEVLPLKEVSRKAAGKAEKEAIVEALKAARWNKAKAARMLKISYKALLYKIKGYNIEDEI